MMEVIVEVCRAFALTVSAKKTETMCMPPPRTPRTMVQVEAAGQTYKLVQSFTYLGDAMTEVPDMSVEIARRTRACWMRIRRYLRELYDQPKIALSQDPNGEGGGNRGPLVWIVVHWGTPLLGDPTLHRGIPSLHRGTPPPTPRDPPPLHRGIPPHFFFFFYAVMLGRRSGRESGDQKKILLFF